MRGERCDPSRGLQRVREGLCASCRDMSGGTEVTVREGKVRGRQRLLAGAWAALGSDWVTGGARIPWGWESLPRDVLPAEGSLQWLWGVLGLGSLGVLESAQEWFILELRRGLNKGMSFASSRRLGIKTGRGRLIQVSSVGECPTKYPFQHGVTCCPLQKEQQILRLYNFLKYIVSWKGFLFHLGH